jgi:DNA-binding Lrp family transcriptional regulator
MYIRWIPSRLRKLPEEVLAKKIGVLEGWVVERVRRLVEKKTDRYEIMMK